MFPQCPTKLCYLKSLIYIIYLIELICLGFIVNGGGVNAIGGPLQHGIPKFF